MPSAAHTIEDLTPDDVEELEPLWNALREHHAAAAPEFGEPRSRGDSWRVRRGQYAGWLSEEGSFCLIAREAEGRAVGYALVRITGPEPIWPGDRTAELETLSVLPGARSAGVGGALLNAARARLADASLEYLSIKVLAANADGLRFYQRHGFEPGVVIVFGDTAAASA
jgi:ribosomal protein S18 acetylase RimI-like enzyme